MPVINSRGRHYRLLLHSQLAFGFKFEDHRYPVEAIITGYDQNNMVHIYYRNTISLRFSSRAFTSQNFATNSDIFRTRNNFFLVLQIHLGISIISCSANVFFIKTHEGRMHFESLGTRFKI